MQHNSNNNNQKIIGVTCLIRYLLLITTSLFGLFSLSGHSSESEFNAVSLKSISHYPNYKLNAEVIPLSKSKMSPEINGHYKEVLVGVGDRVLEGQAIATLACTKLQYDLAIAQARLQQTISRVSLYDKELERNQQLNSQDNLSLSLLEKSIAQRDIERAIQIEREQQMGNLQHSLSQCTLIAPFSGVIVKRYAQVGQFGGPGTTAFELLDITQNRVQVLVPQHLLKDFQAGKKHSFNQESGSYLAYIDTIIPEYSKNRTREARMNTQTPLIAGVTGTIKWQSSIPHIAPQYLKRNKKKLGIYIKTKGKKGIKFHHLPQAQEGRVNRINLPADTQVVLNYR